MIIPFQTRVMLKVLSSFSLFGEKGYGCKLT